MWNTVEQSAKKVCLEAPFRGCRNFCRPFSRPRAGLPGGFCRFWRRPGKALLRGQKRHLPGLFPARFPARKGWPPGAETTRRRGGIWRFGASQTPDPPLPTPSGRQKRTAKRLPGVFRRGGAREEYCHNRSQTAIFARFSRIASARRSGREAALPLYYRRKPPRQIQNSSRENSEFALDDFRFVLGEFQIRRGRISNPPREKSGFA